MMNEMDTLADLGAALSPTEVPEDRLRSRTVAALALPDRRAGWARPALVAAAVVGIVAAAVITVGLAGTARTRAPEAAGPAPLVKPASFTVTRNADGSVGLTVNDLLDLDGATQALNNAGIVGKVLTSTEDCTETLTFIDGVDTVHAKYPEIEAGQTITLRSSDYPPGGGLLVLVHGHVKQGELHLGAAILVIADAARIPSCINNVDPGTGPYPTWPPV